MNYKCCSSSSYSVITSLAGLRRISVPLRLRRKPRKKKIPKVKDKLMDFWHKMIFPVRRVWLALSSRLKPRTNSLVCHCTTRRSFIPLGYVDYEGSLYYVKNRICLPKGNGLLRLQDDVQTCGYQDVQVMWEMLRRTESEVVADSHQKRKQQPFWGIFVWPSNSNHTDHASLESSKSS